MFQDIGLTYDPVKRRCDVSFAGRDFVLDATPRTALLMSLANSRRARPDDELPTGLTDLYGPTPIMTARRGWCGDALDRLNRLIGSRLWLLFGAKSTEKTRLLAEGAVSEAVAWIETQRSIPVRVVVRYVTKSILGIRVTAGATTVSLQRSVAG